MSIKQTGSGLGSGESNPDLISMSHLNSQHGIIVDIHIGSERNNLIQGLSTHREKKINLIHPLYNVKKTPKSFFLITSADLLNKWTIQFPLYEFDI